MRYKTYIIPISYKSLDIFAEYTDVGATPIFLAFAGRKDGRDRYETLDCFSDQAVKELEAMAFEALKDHIQDLKDAEEDERYARAARCSPP